jgi:outer membrane protein TolC
LTQPLFDARAFPLFRQARYLRDATRLTADETKRLLGFEAADAFLVTLGLEQVLTAAEHRRDFARTSLEDVQARFEAGLVSSNDVTRAQLELSTAERELARAIGDVRSSRIGLATLLNADVNDAPLQVPVEVLQAAANSPDVDAASVADAQARRSDIRAGRATVEAFRAFADEPAARFIPSVLLTAQSRNINEEAISDRNNEGFLAVTLNWPVFDAGLRGSERAERDALARGAELQLELAIRGVEEQIRTAGVQLRAEQAVLRQAEAALAAARKNAEETNELYRQGLATALELADATQSLFEAEVAAVTATYRMAQAYLALREARGLEPLGE